MIPQVETLANLMRAKKDAGQKFVIILGAGASMSSGVKSTPKIMEELLQKYGQGIGGASLEDRFDQLWQSTSPDDRGIFLKPYLDCEPSPGYGRLAKLIEAGFFDLVLTFNFDDLLEKVLRAIQLEVKVIIRGETRDDEMEKLADAKEPRVKLAKLHGSLRSSDHFLFNAAEMNRYPDEVEAFLKKITHNNVIMCGYAFNDLCVKRAFSEQGGYVVWVNPGEMPRDLKVVVKTRLSESRGILADFDTFFEELYHTLLEPPSPAEEKPLPNPFKFLEGHVEADKDSFERRDEEAEQFFQRLEQEPPPRLIVVAGPEKAGKTSFTRARLMAGLDAKKYFGVYLRCQPELDLVATLQRLGEGSRDRRVVLFLDQFDRVTHRYGWPSKLGIKELSAFLMNNLFKACSDNVTLVLVVTDEESLGAWLMQAGKNAGLAPDLVQCRAFEREDVVLIIQSLAQKAGFAFDPKIIEGMANRYEMTRNAPDPGKRFTLAHIHTVCHILASKRKLDYDSYEQTFKDNLEILNKAINVRDDIVSFLEDFSWPDAVWLRSMIKVPLTKGTEGIAQFIMRHYEELPVSQRQTGPDAAGPQP